MLWSLSILMAELGLGSSLKLGFSICQRWMTKERAMPPGLQQDPMTACEGRRPGAHECWSLQSRQDETRESTLNRGWPVAMEITVRGSNWGWDGHELSHDLHRQESCCQQVPRVQSGGGSSAVLEGLVRQETKGTLYFSAGVADARAGISPTFSPTLLSAIILSRL